VLFFCFFNLCTNESADNGSDLGNTKHGKGLILNSVQCNLLTVELLCNTTELGLADVGTQWKTFTPSEDQYMQQN
jgi:hypothetical protein